MRSSAVFGEIVGAVASILVGAAACAQPNVSAAAPGFGSPQERRIALVIGNADYEVGRLRNPVNDARAMASTLKGLGFEVRELQNARQVELKRAIDEFGQSLREAGRNAVGLFYYSGHGLQIAGRNWLVPIGARIRSERQAEYESVDLGRALGAMEEAGNLVNIVVVDACRDNPFARSFRSARKGLALIEAVSGTLIAYATAPGQTADDGQGANGLYTGQLIRHMKTPGLKLEDVFKRARIEVERLSSGKQVPWESSSLKGDFYFAGGASATTAAGRAGAGPGPAAVRTIDEEEVLWRYVEGSSNRQDFEEYLRQYPGGRFSGAARIRIRQLERAGTQERPVTATAAPNRARPAPGGSDSGSSGGPANGLPGAGTTWAYDVIDKMFQRKSQLIVTALQARNDVLEERLQVESSSTQSQQLLRRVSTRAASFAVVKDRLADIIEFAPYLFAVNGERTESLALEASGYPAPIGAPDWVIRVARAPTWERVTVPAGSFRALRIDLEGDSANQWNISNVHRFEVHVWYAPEINRYVRLENFEWDRHRMRKHLAIELTELRLPSGE